MRPSKKFAEAISAWRKQPARARNDAVHFFRDEATQSDEWARHEEEMGRRLEGEWCRHREDAAAMRAALAVLKAAERPEVTRKEWARRLRKLAATSARAEAVLKAVSSKKKRRA